MQSADASSGLLRSTAQISVVTAVARALGFARWIVLAHTLGATYLGNTYQTANWVPNILFELAAGGVLSAVFVPTFVAELERDRERGATVASSLANVFLLGSLPLVAAGMLFAEPIMRGFTLFVGNAGVREQQVVLGAWFLRFFLPQIPLYLLAMVLTGILHAHRRFVMPAVAPALSSVIVICTYVTFRSMARGAEIGHVARGPLVVLAGGTTTGVAALALCQLPAVLRLGFRWRAVLGIGDVAVRRAIRAGSYALAYFLVTEIGLIVMLLLTNGTRGGVIEWQVAFAFYELPNALAGLPVAVSAFPTLARRAARADEAGFASLLSAGWRTAALIVVPAAAGLIVLGPVLAHAVLRGDAVPLAAAPDAVGAALRTLAIGLPAYALTATVVRTLYARHLTRPPVAINAAAVGTFCVCAFALAAAGPGSGATRLALIGLAHAAGQWVGLATGVLLLRARVPGWTPRADIGFLGWALARAAVMAVAVAFVLRLLHNLDPIAGTVAGVAIGVAVYALLSARTPEVRRLARTIRS